MGDNRVRIYWRRYGPHGGGHWRAKDNRASGYYIDRTGHEERGAS